MATRPAREAFKHIETSGLPYFTQVRIMVTTVAMAGAMVVVTKNGTELFNGGCSSTVETVPAEPQNENTQCANRKVMSGECVYLRYFACLILYKLTNTGTKHCCTDQSGNTADHVDAVGTCESWKPIWESQPPPHVQCASTDK